VFKEVLSFIFSIIKSRVFILCAVFTVLFGAVIVNLFNIQIINYETYSNSVSNISVREIEIPASRGNIYDRNGVLLAYNELTYTVEITDVIESSDTKNATLNEIVYNTIKIIEANGDSIDEDFPLVISDNGEISFTSTLTNASRIRFLKNMYGTEVLDNDDHTYSETTALEAFIYMYEKKYKIDEMGYSVEDALKVMMIRYNMSLNTYKKYVAVTIASGVSDETVAAVYESENDLPGVVVNKEYVRKYVDAEYFAHIIGYTGKATEDEIAEYAALGISYDANDTIGKLGIEKSYETTLAGTPGTKTVQVDSLGRILSVISETDPVPGDDVYLSIDYELTVATYNLLEQEIAYDLLQHVVIGEFTETQEEENYVAVIDLFVQLFANSVVDTDNFSLESATENEQYIYSIFKTKYDSIMESIETNLRNGTDSAVGSMSEEYHEYYLYIYNKLASSAYQLYVIDPDLVDTTDETYLSFYNGNLSLSAYLKYCISQNWIDTTRLTISNYADADEMYTAVVDYIINSLTGDTTFDNKIYKYLIETGKITKYMVLMTLYDQGILEYNESEYAQLKACTIDCNSLLLNKIYTREIKPSVFALTPCSGSCVITDPDTGEVTCMVSYPSYDNNAFSGSIDEDYWASLNADQSTPLFNRATKGRVAPGSTFKPLSAITALQEGVITASTTIVTKGIYENDALTITPKCLAYPSNHGTITVTEAIKYSCNYFFYEVGFRLGTYSSGTFSHSYGLSRLKKYAEMFGLTEKTGVEIDEYSPVFSTSDTVMSAIGQGSHAYAPVHLARYVSTIANGGTLYSLTLVSKVVANDGTEVLIERDEGTQVDVSESNLEVVRNAMKVAFRGYSYFSDYPVDAAAKTGTSQEGINDPYHGLFISFAPYDDPTIAVCACIVNGYSSMYAGYLVKNVYDYYFGYITLDDILNSYAVGVISDQVTEDDITEEIE